MTPPVPNPVAGQTEAIRHLYRAHQVFLDALANLVKHNLAAEATLDDHLLHQEMTEELVCKYVGLEKKVSGLLDNTLPPSVAREIRDRGQFLPWECDCSILFADMAGFTRIAERISAATLVETLHRIFSAFDDLVQRHGGTKIKTIGDAYMAVFGAPEPQRGHAAQSIRTGLAMQDTLERLERREHRGIAMRIGIHSGRVMAGVVGRDRMQFDVFGDPVNTAARFEAAGKPGRVNVSAATRRLAGNRFSFTGRGMVALKNKAPMPPFFVDGENSSPAPRRRKEEPAHG